MTVNKTNFSNYQIAIFDVANDIANKLNQKKVDDPIGHKMSYIMNAAFSIELYLKGIMVYGKDGDYVSGHCLNKIYSDYPPNFKAFLNDLYRSSISKTDYKFEVFGLQTGSSKPQSPDKDFGPVRLGSFDNALNEFNGQFIKIRYFFEDINDKDWKYFVYAPNHYHAVLNSLDELFKHYEKGSFSGCT